jgi:hypothetical protein
LVPLLWLWYALGVKPLLRGLEVSPERLNVGESYANSAKSFSPRMLRALLVGSVLFALGGIGEIAQGEWLMGVSGMLFFGGCAVVYGYMIKSRRA